MLKILSIVLVSCGLIGCSVRKPCADGGDISWPYPIKGDKTCYQKKQKDGSYVNDGTFVIKHKNGKVALEGQFKDGVKQGIWSQYDENGKKTVEKYYLNGVEKSIPDSQASTPDSKSSPGSKSNR